MDVKKCPVQKRFGRDSNLVSDVTINDICTFTSILCTDQWHVHHTCSCTSYLQWLPSVTKLRSCLPTGHLTASPSSQLSSTTARRRMVLSNTYRTQSSCLTTWITTRRRCTKQLITHEWTEAGNALAYNHGTLLVGRCCFSFQESIQFLECSIPPEGLWSFFCTAHGKGPVDGVGGQESGAAANTARQRGREQPYWFLQRCFKTCEKNQSCGSLWTRPAKSWQNWMSALPIVQSYVEHSRYTTWNAKMIPVSQQPSTRPSLVMSGLRRTGWCQSRRWLLVWLLHRHYKLHLNSTMQT